MSASEPVDGALVKDELVDPGGESLPQPLRLTFLDEVARLSLFLAGLLLTGIGVCAGLAAGSPALDGAARATTYVVGVCGDISFLAAAAAWVRHGGERWLRGATAVTAIAVVGAGLGVFEWIGHGQPAASLEIVAATVTAGALAAAIAAVSAAPARSVRFVVVFATGFAALAIAVLMAPRVRELAGPICNALN